LSLGNPTITYTPRSDATPEEEARTLASVFRYILDCSVKKSPAAGLSERGDNDGIEVKGDSADEPIIRD
jgi:hypothetical protein